MHLENCTGKTFKELTRERREPGDRFEARSETGTHKKRSRTHLNSLRSEGAIEARSSEEERRVDAKALIADEGRDKLRKAMGSCK